jgi:phosphohistidine swiveling domain-containing protein
VSQVSVRAVYKCADGRDFPVEFADEEEAARPWFWDAEHSASPATPLDEAAWLGGATGARRALAEAGYAAGDWFFGGTRHFNGFWFFRERPPTDEELKARERAHQAMREQWGNYAAVWRQRCEPLCLRAIRELREAGPDVRVQDLIDIYAYGFEQTFLLDGADREGLRDFIRQNFSSAPAAASSQFADANDETERIMADLVSGFPTATLQGNQVLWELAQVAKDNPRLLERLKRDRVPDVAELRTIEGAAAFVEGFVRYLEHFGGRTTGWNISTPALDERPDLVIDFIRRTIVEDLPEPSSLVAAAAARREQVIGELEDRLSGDAALLAEFRDRLAGNVERLTVKEGRALRQLTLAGSLRAAILDRAHRLAKADAIGSVEDVFYLLPDEIDAALHGRAAGTLPELVRTRKAEHQRWLGVTPPEVIGGRIPPEHRPEAVPSGAALKGVGASRGVVSGRARLLTSFEQYDRLGPGDILVCGTTTPSWTPLFAIAAAVVAEGGGLLSHTAIAAREYGIPAVVGLRAAMTAIPDGAQVTVDGTAGTVRVQP